MFVTDLGVTLSSAHDGAIDCFENWHWDYVGRVRARMLPLISLNPLCFLPALRKSRVSKDWQPATGGSPFCCPVSTRQSLEVMITVHIEIDGDIYVRTLCHMVQNCDLQINMTWSRKGLETQSARLKWWWWWWWWCKTMGQRIHEVPGE